MTCAMCTHMLGSGDRHFSGSMHRYIHFSLKELVWMGCKIEDFSRKPKVWFQQTLISWLATTEEKVSSWTFIESKTLDSEFRNEPSVPHQRNKGPLTNTPAHHMHAVHKLQHPKWPLCANLAQTLLAERVQTNTCGTLHYIPTIPLQ